MSIYISFQKHTTNILMHIIHYLYVYVSIFTYQTYSQDLPMFASLKTQTRQAPPIWINLMVDPIPTCLGSNISNAKMGSGKTSYTYGS